MPFAAQCTLEEAGEVKVSLEPSEHERLVMLREIEAAINGNEKIAARLRTLLKKKSIATKKPSAKRKT